MNLWEILKPLSMKVASAPEGWKQILNDFWNLWNFPLRLYLGAIDGKHCVINCPPKREFQYCFDGSCRRNLCLLLLMLVITGGNLI